MQLHLSHLLYRRARRASGRLLAVACILLLLLLALPEPPLASAQGASQAGIGLALVDAPPWHGPPDRLNATLRITNDSEQTLRGFRVRLGVRDRALSRSALAEAYAAPPGLESTVIPFDYRRRLPPGESTTVEIRQKISGLPTMAAAVDPSVFPVTLALQDLNGENTLDSFTLPLVYLPERPERPLNLSLLVPFTHGPVVGPDGSLAGDGSPVEPLVEAAAEGGALRAILEALEEVTQPDEGERGRGPARARGEALQTGIAPTPRLLEELALLAGQEGGDEEVADPTGRGDALSLLDGLRRISSRDAVEVLLVPYAYPDLPSTIEQLSLQQTVEQLSAANEIWLQTLGRESDGRWLYPPGGRIDATSLEQLRLLGHAGRMVVGEESLIPLPVSSAGCPEAFFSFLCAVNLQTDAGEAKALVSDPAITALLDSLGRADTDDRVVLQQIVAETAMVHVELPGTPGRVLQVTLPNTWAPRARQIGFLLGALRGAPWLRSRLPDDALEASAQTMDREPTDDLAGLPGAPGESLYPEIEGTRALLDSYASVVPPGSQRLRRLRRNLLVASSLNWLRSEEEASDYVSGTRREVEGELEKITVTGPDDVTLTSREGQVQIVLSNGTGYPVRLALTLDSPNLRFEAERTVETYPPGDRALTLPTATTGSGVFQLAIRLETPDGATVVDEKRIVVRSTSFNQIALYLTGGALCFLVLFYLVKGFRRRRGAEAPAA